MADERTDILDPLCYLMPWIVDGHLIPNELKDKIEALDALLRGSGEHMSPELQDKWRNRAAELVEECEANAAGLDADVQKVCLVTLAALKGRFSEVVEKDYLKAVNGYEKAVELADQVRDVLVDRVVQDMRRTIVVKKKDLDERQWVLACAAAGWNTRQLEGALWDRAGDAYCRLNIPDKAQRCYRQAMVLLEGVNADTKKGEDWQACFCHLSLSLANALLVDSAQWAETERLYRTAADVISFNETGRDYQQYDDICASIIAPRTLVESWGEDSPCTPHAPTFLSIWGRDDNPSPQREKWIRLRTGIGQRVLGQLREEFRTSGDFPVPGTYVLVGALTELLADLGEYEKAAGLMNSDDSFDKAFHEWMWENAEVEGAFAYIQYTRFAGIAEGALRQPERRELLKQTRLMEELKRGQQRQEHLQLHSDYKLESIKPLLSQLPDDVAKKLEPRLEQLAQSHQKAQEETQQALAKVSGQPSIEQEHQKLCKVYPWLDRAANAGSIVNAEFLREALKKRNYGEVVAGYANAVEEELKQCVYKEYQRFVLEKSLDDVGEPRTKEPPSGALHQIASFCTDKGGRQIWEQFAAARMPGHKAFLCELPHLLTGLKEIRNPSAHGAVPDRERVEKVRKIVLGTEGKPGLLQRLVELKPPKGESTN